MYSYLLLWFHLELSEVVNRAQQSCRDEVSPAAPGLGGTWILDLNDLIRVCRHVAVFVEWEVLLWDERDDGLLDCLCVRLPGTRRN